MGYMRIMSTLLQLHNQLATSTGDRKPIVSLKVSRRSGLAMWQEIRRMVPTPDSPMLVCDPAPTPIGIGSPREPKIEDVWSAATVPQKFDFYGVEIEVL